ncbi:rhodanese-like domain-containing protein [Reyranella sp. CPCC 100927]|uniref:rhodanese-like domain-containing protein n=1 Tax=Reyranella sp. CPCC 100927 TaxID=2599616 RepID=UPI0011B473B4|nr:rhodanese-like domain-containing protein [Reyranella sp. CPCC 100927]TWS96830.1 rhodanese-like domain-containing protein [Reyranella sp. CPCC 100927]
MLSKLKQLLGLERPLRWLECPDLTARAAMPVLIDVRGADEFDGPLGHIDGAVNVPVDAIVDGSADLTRWREREIVLVCRTDKRSARAADNLMAAGFPRIAVLRGGMESWNALGLPVARN